MTKGQFDFNGNKKYVKFFCRKDEASYSVRSAYKFRNIMVSK